MAHTDNVHAELISVPKGGGSGGFPRLDQVLDPAASKTFAMGKLHLKLQAGDHGNTVAPATLIVAAPPDNLAQNDVASFQDGLGNEIFTVGPGRNGLTNVNSNGAVSIDVTAAGDVSGLFSNSNALSVPAIVGENDNTGASAVGVAGTSSGIYDGDGANNPGAGGVRGSGVGIGVFGEASDGVSAYFQSSADANTKPTVVIRQKTTGTAPLLSLRKANGSLILQVLPSLSSFANNAAALNGGLAAGDLYTITASDPLQLAIVF